MPTEDQFKTIALITMKLAQLGLEVTFAEPITEGPLITTFRFVPKQAAKVNQIMTCSEDLALALRAEDVLIRRLPGEGVVGISVPNLQRKPVLWQDHLAAPDAKLLLPLNLGVDSQGREYRDDLTRCPHLLIAGSTDSGKTTLVLSMMASLMYWYTPDQLRFVLSDTKGVDYGIFDASPFYAIKPAASMYATWEAMDWLTVEMERRLDVLKHSTYQNIGQYNERYDPSSRLRLPYIVFVIDELADVLGGEKRGESKIANHKLGVIVQKSRAVGIHVVACTQRPSVNVVAGSIKANFPSRLTFRLPSPEDSRTVIGQSGAEHLLSRGDMLYRSANHPAAQRLHSGFATRDAIKACLTLKEQFAVQKGVTQ